MHSPEPHLDQFTLKVSAPAPKKRKITQGQGQQGKPKTVPKKQALLLKRSPSPQKKTLKKKKAVTVDSKKKTTKELPKQKKLNEKERREQLGLGQLTEK